MHKRIKINGEIEFVGHFNSEKLEDYLAFRKAEPINFNVFINFDCQKNKISEWNCLPTDRTDVYIVDELVQQMLLEICKDDIEFIKINVSYNKIEDLDNNLKLLHVLSEDKTSIIFRDIEIKNRNFRFLGTGVSSLLIKEYKKRKLKGWTFGNLSM